MNKVLKKTHFFEGSVLVNLVTDVIFYHKKKIKLEHFFKNTAVEITVGHRRMNEKSFCDLGNIW